MIAAHNQILLGSTAGRSARPRSAYQLGGTMRKAIVILMLLAIAGTALAVDLSNTRQTPVKRGLPDLTNTGTPDNREGGETIGTAFPIGSLPFTDSGNTCDNIDDYDEECPYTLSTSPDVVYTFTPTGNTAITVDLCGSGYDTKTYVYDSGMMTVACNDDFYFDATCGTYVSYLEATLTGGQTYYIVIDGYGGDCGDYVLNVDEFEVCVVDCPADAVLEGEPHLGPDYVDATNGGCNSDPNVFQAIDWINVEPGNPDHGYAWLCARSGWHTNLGSDTRDTDWFTVTAGQTGMMEFTVNGEYPLQMYLLNTDCANIVLLDSAVAAPCVETTITWAVNAGEVYWLWVGPTTFTGPVTEFRYYMKVGGNSYNTVPNEDSSWSQLKAQFR